MRRFSRLTNAFSKKVENLAAAQSGEVSRSWPTYSDEEDDSARDDEEPGDARLIGEQPRCANRHHYTTDDFRSSPASLGPILLPVRQGSVQKEARAP